MLLGVGLFCSIWSGERFKQEFFLGSFIAYPFFIYPFLFANYRLIVPVLPFLIIWLANGVVSFSLWARNSSPKQSYFPGLLLFVFGNVGFLAVLLALFLLPMSISYCIAPYKSSIKYSEVGHWLQGRLPSNSIIVARSPQLSYYSGFTMVRLPYASIDNIKKYAKFHKARYLILDSKIKGMRPQLKQLYASDKKWFEGLELIDVLQNKAGHKVVIYKLWQ